MNMRKKLFSYAPYMILFFIFIALHIANCSYDLIWGDEGFSLQIIRYGSIKEMMTAIINDVHPPLYYFWLRAAGKILGDNVFVYKMASGVFYYLIPVVFWILYRKVFQHEILILSGILYGTMPALKHVNEIRMYPMALFFVSVFSFVVFKMLKDEARSDNKSFFILFIAGACAAYTHYFALVDVASLIIFAMVYSLMKDNKRKAGGFFTVGGLMLLSYLPWIFITMKQMNGGSGSAVDVKELIITAAKYAGYFIDIHYKVLAVLLIVSFLIIALTFFGNLYKGKIGREKETIFYFYMIFALFAVNISAGVAMTLKAHFFSERYIYPLVGLTVFAICIMLKNIFDFLGNDRSRKIIFYLLTFIFVLNGISYEGNFLREANKMQADTLRFEHVIRSSKNVDKMIITNNEQLDWTVLGYYFPEYQHCMWDEKENEDNENCWYILNSGTDIEKYEKSGRKMVYMDTGTLGDGYSVDLYYAS